MNPARRSWLAIPLVAAGIALASIEWQLTRTALGEAVTLWWTHLVPVLLPGYVLGQAIAWLWPRPRPLIWVGLAFLSFPPVVGAVLLRQVQRGDIGRDQLIPLLLYTNLYNPLAFPDVRFAVLLDGCLLIAAVLTYPRFRGWRWPTAPPTAHPRQWVIDGMNWTSLVGLITMAAWLTHRWLPGFGLGWLIDPLALHWRIRNIGVWGLFWTAFGGLGYWLPLTQSYSPEGLALLARRAVQALLAAVMMWMAMRYLAV